MSKEKEVKYPRVNVVVAGTPEETGISAKMAELLVQNLSGGTADLFEVRLPFTAEDAKNELGWEEELEGGTPFREGQYHLVDRYGKKVRLNNNPHNRPFYAALADGFVQEHLNRRYKLNGEALITGQYGNINDGQHTWASLVLAQQEVTRNPEKWKHHWPDGKVTMSRLLVRGIPETDEVVNTINTGRARSLTDVIFRTDLFKSFPKTKRALASKVLDYAVRRLWVRTGVYRDKEAPRRTHSEALDFVRRHKSLLKWVKLAMEVGSGEKGGEDEKTATIGQYVPLGYAVALMYLMAASGTEFDKYHNAAVRSEKKLDFSNAELAEQFWKELPSGDSLRAVREAIVDLETAPSGFGLQQRDYILCAAWKNYVQGKRVISTTLTIKEGKANNRGVRPLVDVPTVNHTDGGVLYGIDRGEKVEKLPKEEPEVLAQPEPPAAAVEAVEKRKEEVRNGKKPKKEEKSEDPTTAARKAHKDVDVFLWKPSGGNSWYLWDADAELAKESLGVEPKKHPTGRDAIIIKSADLDTAVYALTEAGVSVAKAVEEKGDWKVTVVPAKVGGGQPAPAF